MLAGLGVFLWGLERRARLESEGEPVLRMLFVPSVEQGTLVRRGEELAQFLREDAGLRLRTEVPTSYAAVVQALGMGQADIAWMPVFAYEIARSRYGVQARHQVVRSVDRFAIVVTREGPGQPTTLEALAARKIAVPESLGRQLRASLLATLNEQAPGWTEVSVASDRDAILRLLETPLEVDGAVSSYVFSGPHDLLGDGRKELEADRPGTLRETKIIFTTPTPVAEPTTHYFGAIFVRTDSSFRRLAELNGRRFAFADETSTSGGIFPKLLLARHGVVTSKEYFTGGHPNAVQAVYDGKADAGAAFYSPPSAQHARDGTLVGDARHLILRRLPDLQERRSFLEVVRILALTDPIPNDLCVVRRGLSERLLERFDRSLERFIRTPQGQTAFHELVAGVDIARVNDSNFQEFRMALAKAGVTAERLLAAEEEKLARKRAALPAPSGGRP